MAKTQRGKKNECEIIAAWYFVKNNYGKHFPSIAKEKVYMDIVDITRYSMSRVQYIMGEYFKGNIFYTPPYDEKGR